MTLKNSVTVSELSQHFYISETTIRRDLEKLEKLNLVKRTYGGALFLNGLNNDTPLLMRENENNTPKEQIARLASRFIEDGITIFMDSSSTVAKLIPFFEGKSGITVVTNALKTAVKLNEYNDLDVYCTGGKIRKKSVSLIGSTALDFYSEYYADITFFSCRGLSFQKGVTEASDEESVVKKQMLKTSKTKILLCDSTKLDKVYFSLICQANDVDYIILDNEADQSQVDGLMSSGARIIREK